MITLKRIYSDDRTEGVLTLPDGSEIKTLELPWRDNKVNVSCIKEGLYAFKRDRTGKHQWWRLLGVEGRTAIEIHQGSKPEHSNGCILMSGNDLLRMLDFFDNDDVIYILEITS